MSSTLRPLDDLDRPVAINRLKIGRSKAVGLGRVAVASSRRDDSAQKTLSAVVSPASSRRAGAFGPVAWTLCAAAAWGVMVGGRTQVVRLAPATASIYAVLGLNVNLRQMNIEGVVSRLTEEDGRQILLVEGEIRNLADSPRTAPRMKLAVLDASGREIYFWTAAPPKSRLLSGERAAFRARLAAPPQEGREVRVRFAATPDQAGNSDKAGFGS